jgi:hypothetical protein
MTPIALSRILQIQRENKECEEIEAIIHSNLAYWAWDDMHLDGEANGHQTHRLYSKDGEHLGFIFGRGYDPISGVQSCYTGKTQGKMMVVTGYFALEDAKAWVEKQNNVTAHKDDFERSLEEVRLTLVDDPEFASTFGKEKSKP